MLDVGTHPKPVSSWWASTRRSVGGQAATAGRSSVQSTPASRRWASAIR